MNKEILLGILNIVSYKNDCFKNTENNNHNLHGYAPLCIENIISANFFFM